MLQTPRHRRQKLALVVLVAVTDVSALVGIKAENPSEATSPLVRVVLPASGDTTPCAPAKTESLCPLKTTA